MASSIVAVSIIERTAKRDVSSQFDLVRRMCEALTPFISGELRLKNAEKFLESVV